MRSGRRPTARGRRGRAALAALAVALIAGVTAPVATAAGAAAPKPTLGDLVLRWWWPPRGALVLSLRYHLTAAAPVRLRLERLRADGRAIVLRGPWLHRGGPGDNKLVVRFGHAEGHVPGGRYRLVLAPVRVAGDPAAPRAIVFRLKAPPR